MSVAKRLLIHEAEAALSGTNSAILSTMKVTKLTELQIDALCADYATGLPWRQIADKYDICIQSIKNYLRRRQVVLDRVTLDPTRPDPRSAPYIDFFQTIDTEQKAYWLGFIAADGCIVPNARSLQIGLSRKDRGHLECFQSTLGLATGLRDQQAICRSGTYPSSMLVICSAGLITDLDKLGIRARKTYDLTWPTLQTDLIRHFIRGYVDGDGTWTLLRTKRKTPAMMFGVLGQPSFLAALQQEVMAECKLQRTKISPHPNCDAVSRFYYAGNKQCIRIANYLYRDATVWLPRKRNLIVGHFNALAGYGEQLTSF